MKSEWGSFVYLFLKEHTHSKAGLGFFVGGSPPFLMSAFFSSSYFVPLIILEQNLTSLNYSTFISYAT